MLYRRFSSPRGTVSRSYVYGLPRSSSVTFTVLPRSSFSVTFTVLPRSSLSASDRSPPHELRHHVNTTAKVGGAGRTLRHRQPIVAAPPVSHVVSQDYPTMRTAAHTSPTDVTRGGAARASTSASANQRPAADDVTPQLRFNSLVSYSVSAVITWTQADCGDDVKPADSYRLRYNPVGHTTLMTEETLFTNFALLKGLAANTRYHYRVKYVYAGGASGGWSQPAVFDTTIHRAGTQ